MSSTLAATLVLVVAATVIVLLLGFGAYAAYHVGDEPDSR